MDEWISVPKSFALNRLVYYIEFFVLPRKLEHLPGATTPKIPDKGRFQGKMPEQEGGPLSAGFRARRTKFGILIAILLLPLGAIPG